MEYCTEERKKLYNDSYEALIAELIGLTSENEVDLLFDFIDNYINFQESDISYVRQNVVIVSSTIIQDCIINSAAIVDELRTDLT